MKKASKKIIEQYVLGDMMKRMTNLYALMVRYSLEKGSMCIPVSYSTLIMVRTVENALSGRNVPVKAKRERSFGNIKQNRKYRKFPTRGIENMRIVQNLVCTAHNLRVMWGKLKRNVAVSTKIGGLVANSASKVGNFLGFYTIINLRCHC